MQINYDEQKRAAEILAVLKKHELVRHGLSPEKLRLILEDLGPTFVKLGQVMSMRTDFLPKAYCLELEKLRTDVLPLDISQVRQVLAEEYGRPLQEVFADFDEKPLGSASIAQTHAAALPNGRRVAVKVQRPGIRETMEKDHGLLRKSAKLLKLTPMEGMVDFNAVLDEMWAVSLEELDFQVEARNAREFYKLNGRLEGISSPLVEDGLSTTRVLVMEYIDGCSIGDGPALEAMGVDKRELCTRFADNYIKQIIDDGYFHADPHPGNVRVRQGQLVWIDMGMMGRLSDRDRRLMKKGVLAIARRDVNEIINVIMTLGVCHSPITYSRLYEDVDVMLIKYATVGTGSIDLAAFMEEFINVAASHDISLPQGVSMLARGLMTAEGLVTELCPEVNVVEVAARRMKRETLAEFDIKKEAENAARTVLQSGAKSLSMPGLVTDLLESTVKGHTKLNFEITGAHESLSFLERMVDRLVLCMIAAALLVGSSLLCLTQLRPTLLGIPLLSLLGFGAALALSCWLLWKMRKKSR